MGPLRTLNDRISASLFELRFRSIVVGVFALVAVLLSLIGLCGVLSYYVRKRSHEISVRLALGTSLGGVTAWVLGRGMALVGLGIGLGVGFAACLLPALRANRLDPAEALKVK
jgi:ABC-type antimicrobial peptide transport system permease subunit